MRDDDADLVEISPEAETALVAVEPNDQRLEVIAQEIEAVQAGAVLRIGERLHTAREIFFHNRDENGFGGWVERRLRFSRSTAYKLVSVHERFGGTQFVQNVDELPRSILYELAAPEAPDPVKQVADDLVTRSRRGETFTAAQVRSMIAEAKAAYRDETKDQIAARIEAAQQKAEAAAQKRLERAQAKMESEVAALRRDFSKSLPASEVEALVQKAVAPLKEKIAALKDEKRKQKEAAARLAQNPNSLPATAARSAITALVMKLSISPADVIEAQRRTSALNGQPVPVALAETIAAARQCAEWLTTFLKLVDQEEEDPDE